MFMLVDRDPSTLRQVLGLTVVVFPQLLLMQVVVGPQIFELQRILSSRELLSQEAVVVTAVISPPAEAVV